MQHLKESPRENCLLFLWPKSRSEKLFTLEIMTLINCRSSWMLIERGTFKNNYFCKAGRKCNMLRNCIVGKPISTGRKALGSCFIFSSSPRLSSAKFSQWMPRPGKGIFPTLPTGLWHGNSRVWRINVSFDTNAILKFPNVSVY